MTTRDYSEAYDDDSENVRNWPAQDAQEPPSDLEREFDASPDAWHMATLPARYGGSLTHLDPSINYEITLTVGEEQVYPNALDLLEAVLGVAWEVNPTGVSEVLSAARLRGFAVPAALCGEGPS